MNQELKKVLYYVQLSLGLTSQEPAPLLNETSLDMAKIQGLASLVYASLDPKKQLPIITQGFQKMWVNYVQKDVHQQTALTDIKRVLNTHEIPFILLKGSHLKEIYPHSYDRSMGDMDILIHETNLPKVKQYLSQLGYENYENSTQHSNFRKSPHLEVEVHPGIHYDVAGINGTLFNDPWKEAIIFQGFEYRLSPELEYTFLLYHLAKHFQSTGVGLRSILDIGLFLHHYWPNMNEPKLRDFLTQTGLTLFSATMTEFSRTYFGLPSTAFPSIADAWSDADRDLLTDFFLQSGIHGHGQGFNYYLCGMTKHSLKSEQPAKGRRRFLGHLLFPPRHILVGRYPYLKKHGWLLPYAWASRFLRFIFKQPYRIRLNLKNLKINDTQLEKTIYIYKKMGL